MLLKFNNLFFSLLLLSVCFCSNAQDKTIDRLRSVITSSVKDEEKLSAYIQLSGKISFISFNETIKVAEQGLELASKLKDSLAYAELSRNMGVSYYFKGDYEKAATLFYTAARIYEQANKNKPLAYVYNDIAKLFRKNRDLKRAAGNYEKALSIFRLLNDSSGIQMIPNESGVVYEYQGNYPEALKRYRASLQIATQLNDEMGKSWSYNFIAGIYVLQNKFELAEDYHLRALAIRQTLQDTFSLALSYSDLGILYSAWSKPERATYYFEESNRIAERMGYRELLSNNYAEMSKLANVNGDYKTALDYYTWHTQLKDSIFSSQKNRQVEELSTLYETNKKEQQISLQQETIRKRNTLAGVFAALLILSVLLAFLVYNRYKWKQQAKMQSEILNQQELATRSVLEAEEKERSRIAKDLHDGVGQMMSAARMNLSSFYNNVQIQDEAQNKSLYNIIQLVDESCKEVRAVSHSMMPAALLSKGLPDAVDELISKISSNTLTVSFHSEGFDQRLDSNTETIIYRVMQECVNNIIKHAEATELDIALIRDNDGISVTIEDNGKGFEYNASNEDEGIGLKNIRSRVLFLKGTVDFDSAPGKGTLVAIHIPSKTRLA
jgi:signal transduction histidine kinase